MSVPVISCTLWEFHISSLVLHQRGISKQKLMLQELITLKGLCRNTNIVRKMAMPASAICSPAANKNPKLKAIADVEIERSGKFKYILIKVHDPSKEREFKHIVRGNSKAAFHADIFDEIAPAIEAAGLDCECVGGGRILHDSGKRKIEIFGYSQGFGQADHRITAGLVSKKFPSYDNIKWNNEGY